MQEKKQSTSYFCDILLLQFGQANDQLIFFFKYSL